MDENVGQDRLNAASLDDTLHAGKAARELVSVDVEVHGGGSSGDGPRD